MSGNRDDGVLRFTQRMFFILPTLHVAHELGIKTESYLFKQFRHQTGESVADQKAISAALEKCHAILQTEFENRGLGKRPEDVTDKRTFDEMFSQLREFLVKFQQEFSDYKLNFLPTFDEEHKKVSLLVSQQVLGYISNPEYKTLFKTAEELNSFIHHHFQSTFVTVLVESIDDLKRRDALEIAFSRSKSFQDLAKSFEDLFNDNSESDDDADSYL